MTQAFALRHNELDIKELKEEPIPLPKESILLLSQVLVTHSAGVMRDPETTNYLLKNVQLLLSDQKKDTVGLKFYFHDVSIIVDALYKTSLGMADFAYGDMLLRHLD